MKVIITADWHFGYPGRINHLTWAFNSLIEYCIREDIRHIFLLGDLIHHRVYMEHEVSNALINLFDKAISNGIEILLFPGNHDMYLRYSWEVNALKPFYKHVNLVQDVSIFELGGRRFFNLPFIEVEKVYMKVVRSLEQRASNDDILLTHIGIADAVYNHAFMFPNWSIVQFADTKFSKVYAGHFHSTQSIHDKCYYPGSPISFRFDEGWVTHGFFVYDIDQNCHEFVEFYDIGPVDGAPPDYINAHIDSIDEIKGSISGNFIRVFLQDGSNEKEIRSMLRDEGALNVVLVKPKDIVKEVKREISASKKKDIFKAWLEHDKPNLNEKLLIALNEEIVLEASGEQEDD